MAGSKRTITPANVDSADREDGEERQPPSKRPRYDFFPHGATLNIDILYFYRVQRGGDKIQ